MNRKEIPADMSCFRLSLVAFLHESFPELLQDEKFIAARTQAALDIYEDIMKNGGNPLEAEAKDFAIRLLPECEEVFAQYPLTDDFAYSSEYDLLYTELNGNRLF
jgi:hypothetical protein